MGRLDLFFLVSGILLIIQLCGHRSTAQPNYLYHICAEDNYSPNSTYQANLNILLPFLSSSNNNTVIRNGFRNATTGRNPDTVYGSFQCRGDVTSKTCQDCVETAAKDIIGSDRCPNSKQAIIWYDECMLRYSNQSFFSIMQEKPEVQLSNTATITNPNLFNRRVRGLMYNLTNEAVSNTSLFATGEATFNESLKIYGFVQCTTDLSSSNCNKCLTAALSELSTCCGGKQGGRVIRPSCSFQYEIYPFLESTAPPSPTKTNSKGKKSSNLAVFIVVPSVVAILSTIVIIWCFCFRRKKAKKSYGEDINKMKNSEFLQFNFSTVSASTDNFSDANKIGEGGFGSVYKGKLSDGQEIAVKRLSENSGQGHQEFKNEVVLVAKLQHRNLVRLLGFCLDGQEKLLIYEYMPNASLDQILFDKVKSTYLDWEKRYKIIGGIARGLLYLHEDSRLKIIHRDLKASNILLDTEMKPKISDFGMARLLVVDQTQASTKRIVGTYGYMAPEYAMLGQFSVKSDVFSFGVLVLEILSGRKNSSFHESEVAQDLLSYAWRNWKNGTPLDLLDPTLKDSCSKSEVMRCIHIGQLCVQENIVDRPTMATIVLMLNSYSISLPLPLPPAFFMGSRKELPTMYFGESEERGIVSDQSTSESAPWTVNEASITEFCPR